MIAPNQPGASQTPANNPAHVTSIQGCFAESPYLALRDVESEVTAGVVRLEGTVPSYYLKQLAQEIALQHEGVQEVCNHIRVQ